MRPGAHDEPSGRPILLCHARVVTGGGVGKEVVPAAGQHDGNVGMAMELAGEVVDLHRPELVVGATRIVVHQCFFEIGHDRQRRLSRLEWGRVDQIA